MKAVYASLEDKFIILLVNLDVRLGRLRYIYKLHTEDIIGCRWNNHRWMVILHLISYVPLYPNACCYDQTIVDCVDDEGEEEEKKEEEEEEEEEKNRL